MKLIRLKDADEKLRVLSCAYYNLGLRAAKAGNLTAAAERLTKSVLLDSSNVTARNLLGLVRFEAGLFGDAVKHWELSVRQGEEQNIADTYLRTIQNNRRAFEKISDSLRLYNQALGEAKKNSEDIAVIHLKKALESNKNFVYAMNLLAICYVKTGQRSKAAALAERALDVDGGDEIALHLHRELKEQQSSKTIAERRIKKQENIEPPRFISYVPRKEGFSTGLPVSFICLAVGAAVTFFIMRTFTTPQIVEKAVVIEEYKQSYETAVAENEKLTAQLADRETDYAALEKTVTDHENKNASLSTEIETNRRLQSVQDISYFYNAGNFEEAVNLIDNLDKTGFPSETLSMLSEMLTNSHSAIGKDVYAAAKKEYDAKRYDEAKELFQKSIDYETETSTHVGDAYYFLGRIEQYAGNREDAHTYFLKVVNDYPKAVNYTYAQQYERNTR